MFKLWMTNILFKSCRIVESDERSCNKYWLNIGKMYKHKKYHDPPQLTHIEIMQSQHVIIYKEMKNDILLYNV